MRFFVGVVIMFILSVVTAYIKELLQQKGIENTDGIYIILGMFYSNIIQNYILN